MAPKAQIPNARKIAKRRAKLEKKYEKLFMKRQDAIVSTKPRLADNSLCVSANNVCS